MMIFFYHTICLFVLELPLVFVVFELHSAMLTLNVMSNI